MIPVLGVYMQKLKYPCRVPEGLLLGNLLFQYDFFFSRIQLFSSVLFNMECIWLSSGGGLLLANFYFTQIIMTFVVSWSLDMKYVLKLLDDMGK